VALNGVNNDDIGQCANTINKKHNVDSTKQRLKGKKQKNMGLLTQHENQNILQWMQRHPTQHHGMPSSPRHEHNEKDESPWGLKIGHRCNVRSQRPMNGESPT
jgi:hypothetical protein